MVSTCAVSHSVPASASRRQVTTGLRRLDQSVFTLCAVAWDHYGDRDSDLLLYHDANCSYSIHAKRAVSAEQL
jgi:hypothetical protein